MALIKPFRPFHYNTDKLDLSKVVAPPYDVISEKLQGELYDSSPENIIRLDLNCESDPYAAAAVELKRMLRENVLVRDGEPAIYPYFQKFTTIGGDEVTRRGFVSWIKLEPFEAGVVLPHEHTLSGPKMDRLRLMKATGASFSQIFSLYGDQNRVLEKEYDRLESAKPFLQARYDNISNTVYRITDAQTVRVFQKLLEHIPVYIADGHHRYETALEYQRQAHLENPAAAGDESYDYIMMYFTNMFDEGLVVYPTHRIIHSVSSFDRETFLETVGAKFGLTKCADLNNLVSVLHASGPFAFGLILPGSRYFLLKLKKTENVLAVIKENLPAPVKRLDVTLLHDVVLDQILGISKEAQEKKLNINYTIEKDEVDAAIQSGKGQIGFLLNPTKVEQVREVADAGAVMPQKSTYFYPKLLSGLLLSSLK